MTRTLALIAVICALLIIPFAALPPLPAQAAAPVDALAPLPKGCGGGLPPNADAPVCCMFGYVFMDGQPVSDAYVLVYVPGTDRSVGAWTALGPDSDQPYFRLSLSGAPLSLQPGEVVKIDAYYASHAVTTSYTVIGGGQEVDLVITPNSSTDGIDYVPERQVYAQDAPGDFNMNLGDLAIDGSNTVYVTDWGNQRVQVFNRDGTFLRQWGRLGEADGNFIAPSGVAVDAQGNVYVADYGDHRVNKFTNTGEFIRRWGTAGSQPGQFTFPSDVIIDGDGLVYVADTGNQRVQVFDGDGNFVRQWGGLGSGDGQLNNPGGLALGPNGTIYVADSDNGRVQVFSQMGAFVKVFATPGGTPEELLIDGSGRVLVADRQANIIRIYSAAGAALGTIGAPGVLAGQFNGVGGLALDSAGRIYAADSYNNRVQIFSAAGALLASFGQVGQNNRRVYYPGGATVDAQGNLYVTEQGKGTVKRFDASGAPLPGFGNWGGGPGEFVWPKRIAAAPDGTLYVADMGNNRIQQLTATGSFIREWGSPGSGDGQFNNPYSLAVAANGDVYVADSDNNRIQQFTSSGGFVRQWGGLGSGDGQFNGPVGVAVAPSGAIYVADTSNHRIQQFTASGGFVRQWGSYGNGPGQLADPAGIAVDPDGVVYVAEYSGYRFQRFSPSGAWLGSFGWSGSNPGSVSQPNDIDVLPDGRIYLVEPNLGRVQLLRRISYTRPIATIVAASPQVVTAGQAVDLLGRGADSNSQSAVSYEWRLGDSAQPFATSAEASLPTTGLAPGDYTVSLRVRDAQGEVSDPRTVTITVAQTVTDAPRTWTFLLYLAGDNSTGAALGNDSALGALARLRSRVGPANVSVAALFDGPRSGDSARYLLRPGQPDQITSLGEVNTGDPQTLSDFIAWGRQAAPADAYYLAIADHGNALDGIGWDYTSDQTGHERLTMPDLRQALTVATDGGAHPVDILHLDSCLMGLLETAYQMRGMARYMLFSENLAWSSFGYEDYRDLVGASTSARDLALGIADSYAGAVTPARLPYTISALDMAKLDPAAQAADALAGELIGFSLAGVTNRDTLSTLRSQVQKFDSGGDGAITTNDEYVDLDHWAELLQGSSNVSAAVKATATALRGTLASLVISSRSQSGQATVPPATSPQQISLTNARGIAIYYPPQPGVQSYQTYSSHLGFAADTRWDDWLQAQLTALGVVTPATDPNPVPPLDFPRSFSVYLPLVRR
ncbi:PKD domain-containing protein [Chloroflexales bacterium ZM16-3]|nr:PKD domain-containing protein [Chloroflexales bacterium ZM16-3]